MDDYYGCDCEWVHRGYVLSCDASARATQRRAVSLQSVGHHRLGRRCNARSRDFEVPTNVLGLIALSQGVYIGGKAVGPTTIAELEKKISELRELERSFATAVGATWKEKAPTAAMAKDPSKVAPEEFNRYMAAVRPAAEIVREVVGSDLSVITHAQMLPTMPTYGRPVETETV